MVSDKKALSFVTIEDLLSYGATLTYRTADKGVSLPVCPPSSSKRSIHALEAMSEIRAFVERSRSGFPDAETYRSNRRSIIDGICHGDELVFYAAWNRLLAEGALSPLYHASIGSVQKPTGRRPLAIVPRKNLTSQLTQGRVVIDLGDDRFWLLPRDLAGRTLLFAMRHGVSRVDSKIFRVGRRLANVLDTEKGIAKSNAVSAALARMVGVVGQQLDFLHLENYLDPRTFIHLITSSPNTKQLLERVIKSLIPEETSQPNALIESTLESQDFGWATGMKKAEETKQVAETFGVNAQLAKRLLKHPLYSYPGGHSFFDLYVDVVDGLHRLSEKYKGGVVCLYTHSSTLRALITYLDPRPFHEAFKEFGEYKEEQENVVLLTYEKKQLFGYSTAVGLPQHDRINREVEITVERQRVGRVTLRPQQLRQIVVLVSGGDFSGAGAALKEFRATGERMGLAVYFVRHGFLGLANNWIESFTEREMRGMAKQASSPIGSSRFNDFKDEEVQRAAIRHLAPYLKDGALVVIGGDGSLRGARAVFENFGVQAVGLPGTIDNNIAGTTSLGFRSAVALANQSLESLKATSAAMGSIFFVELMGAGSGHLALACAYQARAEGILVNEHPDPDAYIDETILWTLKRTLGVPNKSHLFIVAEKAPHRHHALGGVHGLVEYVADTITHWPQLSPKIGHYPLTVTTKATILGHTLRGAPPVPEDKMLAQYLAYETIRLLIDQPEEAVGCLLKSRAEGEIDAVPFQNIKEKSFDWETFARMHGSALSQ